jgi:hypothetical protein
MDILETLRRIMPLTAECDISVDWDFISRSWGTKFPDDYRRFIEIYGAGEIENFLAIFKPEPKGGVPGQESGGMVGESATVEAVWAGGVRLPELANSTPRIISWGVDVNVNILCWDASHDHPDKWPILVYGADDNLWSRYDCGMVEFLTRILRADFSTSPLGDVSLWGAGTAKFLNHREYVRLLKQGLDPWTGEPDPYAGMYDY